jgi:hypothetical protein
MRKETAILFSLMILSIPLSAAHNETYWNKRAERISAEEKALERSGISPLTAAYFDNESKRCLEASKNAKSLADNPESLSEAAKPVTETDIAVMADEIASGMSSYKTLIALYSSPSASDEETVKGLIRAHITAAAAESGIEADSVFIADIFRGMPSPETALYECAQSRISAEADILRSDVKMKASAAMRRELSPHQSSATGSFIEEAKKRAALSVLNGPELKTPAPAVSKKLSSLDGIFSFIDRRIGKIAGIKRLMPETSSIKASELHAAVSKPETLDTKIFSPLTAAYCVTTPYIRETKDKKILALPKDPDCAALFAAVDSERRKVLKLGKSAFDDGIENAEKNMEKLITDTFRESAEAFFRASEKSKLTESGNAAEFESSKKIYASKLDGAKKYRDASIAFLKAINQSEESSSIEFIRTKLNALSDGVSFTKKQIDRCRTSPYREFSYTPQLHSSIKQFAAKLDAAAKISKEEREGLAKSEIADANAMYSSFSKKLNEMLKDAGSLAAGKGSAKKVKAPSGAVQAVSQKELDFIGESVKEKVKALSALTYTERALNAYAEFFAKMQTAADSGRTDDQLSRVFKDRTLTPSVREMDVKKVGSEAAERAYLRKSITADLSYVESASAGSGTGYSLVTPLSESEISLIKQLVRTSPSVKIAGKMLHEKNIGEIDRFAFNLLETRYRKATWGKDAPMKNSRTDITEKGFSFGVVLPEGFSETSPSFNANEHSVIRYFGDGAGERTIMFALLPASGKADDALRDWISSMGRKPVSKEHPKINGVALAVLASYKDAVMEAYIIEKNGAHLIIAGECPKTKHGFFQGTLRSVVSSVEIK